MNKDKLTLAVIILTAFSFSSFASPPQDPPDNLGDYKLLTWNMQGANEGEKGKSTKESRYVLHINRFANGNGVPYEDPTYTGNQHIVPDILFLQEVGAPPSTATDIRQLNPLFSSSNISPSNGEVPELLNPDQLPLNVQEFRWGTSRRGRWAYIVESDSAPDSTAQAQTNQSIRGRVNLAIMTHWRPTSVIILRAPAGGPGVRPIFGIRHNDIYFFNIHAPANGGRNSAAIVRTIHNYFATRNDRTTLWAAVGDFNIEPFEVVRNPGLQSSLLRNLFLLSRPPNGGPTNAISLINSVRIISQSQLTQSSGGILDYMVIGRVGGDPSWPAQYDEPPEPPPGDFRPSRVDHCDTFECADALPLVGVSLMVRRTISAMRAATLGSDHYPVMFLGGSR